MQGWWSSAPLVCVTNMGRMTPYQRLSPAMMIRLLTTSIHRILKTSRWLDLRARALLVSPSLFFRGAARLPSSSRCLAKSSSRPWRRRPESLWSTARPSRRPSRAINCSRGPGSSSRSRAPAFMSTTDRPVSSGVRVRHPHQAPDARRAGGLSVTNTYSRTQGDAEVHSRCHRQAGQLLQSRPAALPSLLRHRVRVAPRAG